MAASAGMPTCMRLSNAMTSVSRVCTAPGVQAVSGQWQRAAGVCTKVVQCEAKMALEYLIFYLTSAKYGHLPCKQHEPRLQATHCIYSTQGIYSPKSFNLLPCKAWAPTLVNILNELGGCMWVFLRKLMSELVSNTSAQCKPRI